MKRPSGCYRLLGALALVFACGTPHAHAQSAQKKVNQGGPGPEGQGQAGKVAVPKQVPPTRVPPLQAEAGNCTGFASAFYLETCSAPGFSAVVEPMLKDRSYPAPAYEKDWQTQIKPFVPCIIQSLSSKDPCVQMAAIALLREAGDNRAVEPLLDLLKQNNGPNGVAAEARQTLAVTFKDAKVVPYLVQALSPPFQDEQWIGYDLQAVRDGPRDPRLFDALYHLLQAPHIKHEKGAILTALVDQQYGPACDKQLRKIFVGLMCNPGCIYGVDRLALAIASEETFDDIQSYFFTHGAFWGSGLPLALKQVGGERYAAFLRKYFAFTKDEQQKKWIAGDLLNFLVKGYPTNVSDGKDSLDWLAEQAGNMLPYAPASAVWPILELSPDAKPEAPALKRVAFYEKAAKLFSKQNEIAYQIQRRLYDAYGPNGTNEPEKSLAALYAANKAYTELYSHSTSAGGPWALEEAALRRDIAVQGMRQSLRIVDAHPASTNLAGSWSASLILPAAAPYDLSTSHPIAYLDIFGELGLTRSVPASVSFEKSVVGREGRLRMTIVPYLPEQNLSEKIRAVRIRLLFLPEKDGFYGTVISEEVHRSRTLEPADMSSLHVSNNTKFTMTFNRKGQRHHRESYVI